MKNYISLIWKWTLDNPKKMNRFIVELVKYFIGFNVAMFFVYLYEDMLFFCAISIVLIVCGIINIKTLKE